MTPNFSLNVVFATFLALPFVRTGAAWRRFLRYLRKLQGSTDLAGILVLVRRFPLIVRYDAAAEFEFMFIPVAGQTDTRRHDSNER